MTANKRSTGEDWIDEDDAPDLSTPDYQAKMSAATPRRGRNHRRRTGGGLQRPSSASGRGA